VEYRTHTQVMLGDRETLFHLPRAAVAFQQLADGDMARVGDDTVQLTLYRRRSFQQRRGHSVRLQRDAPGFVRLLCQELLSQQWGFVLGALGSP